MDIAITSRYANLSGQTTIRVGRYTGIVGRVARVSNSTTLTIEQKYPIDGAGAMIGVSNVQHLASVGDMISIVNAYQQGSSLRGRWNTVHTILEPF